MCGIIGIIDNQEDVSYKLYYSLIFLQHRGQDACGIVTSENNKLYVKKKNGLALDSFSEDDLKLLVGKIGVAHNRYSTTGSINDNTQPLIINSNKNKIVLAHNGNLINYSDLHSSLEKDGCFLTTDVDSEVIIYLIRRQYEFTKDIFESIKFVMSKIKGAYSVVGFIEDKGLFAFRDPNGIRPLVIGKKEKSYAITSESVVLQTIDYDFLRDVEPGEIIFINKDTLELKSTKFEISKNAYCMFEWVYFSRPESLIQGRSVYKARLALGTALAKRLKDEEIDVIIPVPDTARTCAIKLAQDLNVNYGEGLIKNRYVGRTFIMPTNKSRISTLNVKLNPVIGAIKDKVVCVVDDSIVRGSTSRRIIELIRKGGAKKVIFASSCPPIKYPCYYGIDMSTEEELIASNKTIEEIRVFIGADKLIYATIDDIKDAIKKDLCCACLNNKYPIEVSDQSKLFFINDKKNR